jgi:hypothetical protein
VPLDRLGQAGPLGLEGDSLAFKLLALLVDEAGRSQRPAGFTLTVMACTKVVLPTSAKPTRNR